MRKILITGGTIFVSRYIAEYFAGKGDAVYVLNRNHHLQPDKTILIEADRHKLEDMLKQYTFDAVLDVTAYTEKDVSDLLDALENSKENVKDYILISSSAVYPETLPQPFSENQQTGTNKYWGTYGINKMKAEKELLKRVPDAYIVRPPYLYGPMNNVYREAFVFECANQNRKFYLPKKGDMKLQFFHVRDLCRCIEAILDKHPSNHIFNVGNTESVTIREWVEQCYHAAGYTAEYVEVYQDIKQREYFCFYDYEYQLDLSRQKELIETTIPLEEGLQESYLWYCGHKDEVERKGYMEYIDKMLNLSRSFQITVNASKEKIVEILKRYKDNVDFDRNHIEIKYNEDYDEKLSVCDEDAFLYYKNRISFYPKDDNVTLEMQVPLAKDIVKKFADHEIPAEIIAEFEHLL